MSANVHKMEYLLSIGVTEGIEATGEDFSEEDISGLGFNCLVALYSLPSLIKVFEGDSSFCHCISCLW